MSVEDMVLDYIRKKCETEGLETKPRIYQIARELNLDREEVLEAVKKLEAEGLVQYVSDVPSESHICPAVPPEEMLKFRVLKMVVDRERTEVYEIARLLDENVKAVVEVVKKLESEGKVRYAGEGGSSWIEPVR